MSNTGNQIQDWVQIWADSASEVITSGDGLEILNEVYHGMFNPEYMISVGGRNFRIGRRWAEAYATTDFASETTSGTSDYAWPTSPIYREEPIVELETSASSGDFEIIDPARDENEWASLRLASNGRPFRYRRLLISTVMNLRFAPTPSTTSLVIRLRGQQEITKFTATTAADGATLTIFFNEEADQALAYFIAALFKAKRGDSGRAVDLIQNGLGLLPASDYMPAFDDNQITAHYL